MGQKIISLDPKVTSNKEIIRRNIRHALSLKSPQKFPNIDITSELFEEVPNMLDSFVKQYRDAGGKFIPCRMEEFNEYLVKFLKKQKYTTLFCADHSLGRLLKENEINYSNALIPNFKADAAIIYSDLLIARTGSIIFSQKYMLYPSIRNMAEDVIVVAKYENLVGSLKDALQVQAERNNRQSIPLYEIITPTPPEVINGKEHYSMENPRFLLFLVY